MKFMTETRNHCFGRRIEDEEFVYTMALLESGRTQYIYPNCTTVNTLSKYQHLTTSPLPQVAGCNCVVKLRNVVA